jgi:simple sugar transport system ATP-binding protein
VPRIDDSLAGFVPAIALSGIDKSFGEVRANRDVNLVVATGSIHGIVGENGAGKSTLMSILYGFYEADRGAIRIKGEEVRIRSSKEAIAHGIGMVHQHFMLVEPLSVIDNVMLGAEGGVMLAKGEAQMRAALAHLSREYGLKIDPDAIIGDLPVGLQQRVEILKALVRGAELLILDEPTAVLTPDEAEQLFVLLRTLAAQGKTVILITHKLNEIMAVTDHVSVMRRGEMVAHFETAKTSPEELAEQMVGRHVLLDVVKGPAKPGPVRLSVKHLVIRDAHASLRVKDVSFQLRAGEILGLAGVAGNGQSEVLEALAGILTPTLGRITLDGKDLLTLAPTPAERREQGVLHIPEDRQRMGLVPQFDAAGSMILGFQDDDAFGAGPLLSTAMIKAHTLREMELYDIRPRNAALKTAKFSGGNQQKIVLAREIEHQPKVLLVGQPTRGVDVGAIEFIHKRLIALRDAGVAILLVSVELDEIISLSDRIIVMCGGVITGERLPDQTDDRDLGLLMAGVTERAA